MGAASPRTGAEPAAPAEADRRARVIIENVDPEIDCGRFPVKRTPGEQVQVEADVFCDGHDVVAAVVRFGRGDDLNEVRMKPLINDRWRAVFSVGDELGAEHYTIQAWVDRFATWQRDLRKRVDANEDVTVPLASGAALIRGAAERASGEDASRLRGIADRVEAGDTRDALDEELAALMLRYDERPHAVAYVRTLPVLIEPERARFSTWYEVFPRSVTDDPNRHGTLRDVTGLVPSIAESGFDVLYLPPIHPIAHTNRKGRNNNPVSEPGDVGSPWAIGAEEGGHTAIHPDLGTFDDFDALVAACRDHGIDLAVDIAFQCSPEHPYVKEHPEWFKWRPDGTIQYAENPPKKYQDIYPLDFECEAWRELWDELASVVRFWVDRGVRIFRVDNPHTKPFRFWEWLIAEIKRDHPEVIFLAEAFTRPRVMERLAKLGFSQSYTYFAWRNTKWELEQYMNELTTTELRHYFRPNFWPNTPDILTEYLQYGGRGAFMARLVLAATLSSSYGIYGPAFELMEGRAAAHGSEEYLDSEKYQIRIWDRDRPDGLRDLVSRLNRMRHQHPALQTNDRFKLHHVDNDNIIGYSKVSADGSNVVLCFVNVDPYHVQAGWTWLDLEELGIDGSRPFQVHDLITDAHYLWNGPRNYIELSPWIVPAHVFAVRTRVRTEQDFDYYL
ncbi:MAG TPA: alpha-1,4-glucan--maltose-1-phosphate maltosyltransferase [Actinomycetota bacterium]|nr:alpha-1,4-glucan--maltose-1-phosphate maltosyltransferase [Actinomycetota bacterium]